MKAIYNGRHVGFTGGGDVINQVGVIVAIFNYTGPGRKIIGQGVIKVVGEREVYLSSFKPHTSPDGTPPQSITRRLRRLSYS
ncbi:MAG TPA: hypothetical protein VEA59_04320 [Patescibacteria group bacterium]|nr:hypothetical protein [Patescibacteria group bacterium]